MRKDLHSLLAYALLGTFAASPSVARIGDTQTECVKRYGEPIKVLSPDQLFFHQDDLGMIIFFSDGKAHMMAFKNPPNAGVEKNISSEKITSMLKLCGGDVPWKREKNGEKGFFWVTEDNALQAQYLTGDKLLIISGMKPSRLIPSDGTSDLNTSNREPEQIQQLFNLIAQGDIESCRDLIISNPGLLNKQDSAGRTALHMAVLKQNADMTRYFIRSGSNINSRELHLAMTPLHLASIDGNVTIGEILIENGAEINVLNLAKHTPLDLGVIAGNKDMAEFLRQHGALTGEEIK